jgi:hypothetical protein
MTHYVMVWLSSAYLIGLDMPRGFQQQPPPHFNRPSPFFPTTPGQLNVTDDVYI